MTDRSPPSGDSPKPEPDWWEKTVEYKFVVDILPKLAAAFPFAGKAEKAWGDLLLSAGSSFRLIEFKRTAGDIRAEKKKFPLMCKEDAVAHGNFHQLLMEHYSRLCKHRGHAAHWLIYGERGADADNQLVLRFRHYGGKGYDALLQTGRDLEALQGVDRSAMIEYLAELGTVRGCESLSGSGLSVVGVSEGSPFVLTIQEFREAVQGAAPRQSEYEPSEQNQHRPRVRV